MTLLITPQRFNSFDLQGFLHRDVAGSLSMVSLIVEILIAVHLHIGKLNKLVDILDLVIAATSNAHRDTHLRNHTAVPA